MWNKSPCWTFSVLQNVWGAACPHLSQWELCACFCLALGSFLSSKPRGSQTPLEIMSLLPLVFPHPKSSARWPEPWSVPHLLPHQPTSYTLKVNLGKCPALSRSKEAFLPDNSASGGLALGVVVKLAVTFLRPVFWAAGVIPAICQMHRVLNDKLWGQETGYTWGGLENMTVWEKRQLEQKTDMEDGSLPKSKWKMIKTCTDTSFTHC